MLLIYSTQISSRLQYVLQLFFGELIQTDYRLTSDTQEFQSYQDPKLNYSKEDFGDAVFINAHGLLFETGLRELETSVASFRETKILFSHHYKSDLPFDPFAATFYLVSRYEEYLPFAADSHGRFPDTQSLNYREGFHEMPVVNYYAGFVKEVLLRRYPQLSFKTPSYHFQLTYDIDFAFAYRNKGFIRNAGAYWRSIRQLDWKEIYYHTQVLMGTKPDPFNTFALQFSLHKKYKLNPVYFFLLADYGAYDKNISASNKEFQTLIRQVTEEYESGIHSSYASNNHPEKIGVEKERLEEISGKKIFRNRQHFLKLRFPLTYQHLLANGITEDYTMGYASLIGFRAGIASPYLWFDLMKNEITSLRIFPFAVMDATLHYYQRLNTGQALLKTKELIDEVKKVSGTFQFLAHNDMISADGPWPGWHKNFELLLAYACEL